jgi:hypothetical protein
MGYRVNRSVPLLVTPSPSPWAARSNPVVTQSLQPATDPSTLSPSLPMEVAMACSSIDRALAPLGEIRAMAEKMATTEEAKRIAPPDVRPSSPQSDGRCSPSPYFPPPRHAILKRRRRADPVA